MSIYKLSDYDIEVDFRDVLDIHDRALEPCDDDEDNVDPYDLEYDDEDMGDL